jgi:hypothetical protein
MVTSSCLMKTVTPQWFYSWSFHIGRGAVKNSEVNDNKHFELDLLLIFNYNNHDLLLPIPLHYTQSGWSDVRKSQP